MTIYDLADNWIAPDGWPLARVRLEQTGEERRGSLLFLTGRADHMEKYAESMRHWAAAGWAVESFDWRGQGGSGRFAADTTVGHAEDFRHWLDDLAAYCREWYARTPSPHVIIAHSMGGHLLLRALAEERVEVDAAILIAPMIGIRAGGLPAILAGRIARAACALGHRHRSLWPSRARTPQVEHAIRTHLTHSVERFAQEARFRRNRPDLMVDAPSWGWLHAAYSSMALLGNPGMVERVTAPMLILASTGDRLVSTPAIRRVARRLRNARFHVYGGHVAHEILREVDAVRDDALARIADFLDECAPVRLPSGAKR